MTFNDQEISLILAGLRLIQRKGLPYPEELIATNDGQFEMLGDAEIDDLCERLNCDDDGSDRDEVLDLLDDVSASLQTVMGQFGSAMTQADRAARGSLVEKARTLCDRLLRDDEDEDETGLLETSQ